ncbi:succinylglutamate desuccinylase [Serratia plymuthica]|uniref:succinylglutamate desuccinylase n=1 Tax=Serratia plymuthica TaxID=82996 RepID=UPI001BAEB75C|nr:succinylglutamate desuccinylase [Serratia plymuthica]QUY46415.1 succinylglutamate desuccinylase [Serratia plymuthica]
MFDLLALTLAGQVPAEQRGDNLNVHWRWLGEGLLEITPHQAYRQAVVLSAGIHGNETAPIELLNQLVNALLAGERPLAVRLLVVLGNPAAIRAGKRYLHSDMNRMFGGRYRDFNHSGETARAQQLEQVITAFFDGEEGARFHYDLHTAIRESRLPRFGILPFQTRPYSADMLEVLDAADLDALVIHSAPGGTFSHFSSEHAGAASCTLELGKAKPFGSNDLQQFAAINRALQAVVSDEPLPLRPGGALRLFRVAQSLIKRSEDFRLHLSDDTANFTELEQGTLLCEQPGEEYRVQHASEWILFPNPGVALGLRAGMVLTEVPRSTLY